MCDAQVAYAFLNRCDFKFASDLLPAALKRMTLSGPPHLDACVAFFEPFLELNRRIKRADNRVEIDVRMMTFSGVGPIASLTFKAAVDDPTRFELSRTVGAAMCAPKTAVAPFLPSRANMPLCDVARRLMARNSFRID